MADVRRLQHPNARLTPRGRAEMVELMVVHGWSAAAAAERFNVSVKTARKYRGRFLTEGRVGLEDRSSRPRSSPNATPGPKRAEVIELRRRRRRGAGWIGAEVGLAASTVQKILNRENLGRLDVGDRASGGPRRYVRDNPGDLVHVDVKKLAAIPPGGGWRARGRADAGPRRRVGYVYIHSALDDNSRLVYSEIHRDEKGTTAAAFWRRARAWYAERGVIVQRVLTDNGGCYRSKDWAKAIKATRCRHKRTRPYRPQTNGKIERYHRTLLQEWAYIRPWTSETQRRRAYQGFLHYYNHHRTHSALRWNTPASTIGNNLCGTHT